MPSPSFASPDIASLVNPRYHESVVYGIHRHWINGTYTRGRTGGWTTIYDTAGLDGEVIVVAVAPLSCLQLRARGQERLAHQVRVHPARRLAPFPDRPHDQRLPPPRIPAREHTRHRRLVVRPGLHVAALGECAAELRDHRGRLRAEEAQGQA